MTTCHDLKDIPGFPGCCNSCHEDNEEYGYWLMGCDEIEVCCKVNEWLGKKGIDTIEPPANWREILGICTVDDVD